MILTKYPEYVEMQLKELDKRIIEIYEQEISNHTISTTNSMRIWNYQELERVKRCCYARIKPFLDEKVRLITNSVPTYIIKKDC